jgi:hypothetical protein
MAETVRSEAVINVEHDEGSTTPITTGDTQVPTVGVPGVTFTVRDAARACAVHANTVRRRLKGGEFPNAFRDHTGTWRIPVADLEAAGLRPQRSRPEADAEQVVVIPEAYPTGMSTGSVGMPTGMPTLREAYEALRIVEAEADALREEVQELSRRAAFAETLAQERSERIDDLRIALRALEAVNPRPEDRAAQLPRAQTPPLGDGFVATALKSRWFRRPR